MSANSTTSARSVLYHIRDKGKTKQKRLKNRSYLDIIVIMRAESSECQNIEFDPEELQLIEKVQRFFNGRDADSEGAEEEPFNVLELVKHSRCMVEQWKKEGLKPLDPKEHAGTNNFHYRLRILLGDLEVDPGLLKLYMSDLEPIKDQWETFLRDNADKINRFLEFMHTEQQYVDKLRDVSRAVLRILGEEGYEKFKDLARVQDFSRYYIAKREAICLELSEAMRKAGIDPEPFYK